MIQTKYNSATHFHAAFFINTDAPCNGDAAGFDYAFQSLFEYRLNTLTHPPRQTDDRQSYRGWRKLNLSMEKPSNSE